jgi:hypothetical protein
VGSFGKVAICEGELGCGLWNLDSDDDWWLVLQTPIPYVRSGSWGRYHRCDVITEALRFMIAWAILWAFFWNGYKRGGCRNNGSISSTIQG